LINRYYDPTTDQFLSVDPKVSQTDQPYVFTNDSPLNATDPLGLKGWYCINGQTHYYKGSKYGAVGNGACATGPSKSEPVTQVGRLIPGSNPFQRYLGPQTDSGTLNIVAGGGPVHVTVMDDGAEGQAFVGLESVSLCDSNGSGGCATRGLIKIGDTVEFTVPTNDAGTLWSSRGTYADYQLSLEFGGPGAGDVTIENQVWVGSSTANIRSVSY
jgi:hypothetical protein